MEKNIANLIKALTGSYQKNIEDVKNGKENSVLNKYRYPPIAISRELGSGGRIIGQILAKKLNYNLYDKNLIEIISKNEGLNPDLVEILDQGKLSNIELWIENLFEDKGIDEYEYITILTKVIHSLAEMGKAIFLGRASHIVLGAGESFRVRIIAPMELRIENLMKYENIDHDTAKKMIIQSDKDRNKFLKSYFNTDINCLLNYDLVINVERFSSNEKIADTIINTMKNIIFDKQ